MPDRVKVLSLLVVFVGNGHVDRIRSPWMLGITELEICIDDHPSFKTCSAMDPNKVEFFIYLLDPALIIAQNNNGDWA